MLMHIYMCRIIGKVIQMKKHVTYSIPEQLDQALRHKVERGQISQFVTKALWEALKRDEDALLQEFLEADKEAGNLEVKKSFSKLEGEDFTGLADFTYSKAL